MMAAQFNIDVVSQLKELLPSFKLSVPSFVMGELENIHRRSAGKTRTAASVALKMAQESSLHLKNIPLLEDEQVDNALIRISHVLCTNDRQLRKKAKNKGITVIYLRQRKYLAVDGYLKCMDI